MADTERTGDIDHGCLGRTEAAQDILRRFQNLLAYVGATFSTAAVSLALAAGMFIGGPVSSSAASLLVEPDWLASKLADAKVVVLHVGNKAGYDKARFVEFLKKWAPAKSAQWW